MPNHHEKDLTAVLVQRAAYRLKAAPAGHCSRGVPDCQADGTVSTAAMERTWTKKRRLPEPVPP